MRSYFHLASAILAASLPLIAHGAEPKKLNIVYILTDEWRGAATGYAGDPNVKTPNLDQLAKESLDYPNAVSVAPVCTPYRAALMTGRYPTSTGMFLNDAHLPDSELCMAEIFDQAGYTTGYIGKWHLDGHGRSAYIPPERRQGWEYWKGAECDHTYAHSHYYTGTSNEKKFWEGIDSRAQTKDAQAYLRAHAKADQPFVLMVSYGTPHFPYKAAPEDLKALYPPEKIKLPPNVPPGMRAMARSNAQGYYAFCTMLDQCIGDLLKTLDETGLSANSIVVFTSDHGETLGSHGVRPNNKQVPWSDAARVPFLLRVPSVAARKVSTPLTTPDILPTLLGLTGVGIPKTIEGQDLSASVKDGGDLDRAALYMGIAPFLNIPDELRSEYRAIRTSRHTYVRNLKGPWLLYDDQADPYQMHNLVGEKEHQTLVKELDQRLQAELKKVGDDFRPGPSYTKEWGFKVPPHGSVGYDDINEHPQTPQRSDTR